MSNYLDGLINYGQQRGKTPQEIALGVRRWEEKGIAAAQAYPDPEKAWHAAARIREAGSTARARLGLEAFANKTKELFPDENERAAALGAVEQAGWDWRAIVPAESDDPASGVFNTSTQADGPRLPQSALARLQEADAAAADGAFRSTRVAAGNYGDLVTEGANRLGSIAVRPATDGETFEALVEGAQGKKLWRQTPTLEQMRADADEEVARLGDLWDKMATEADRKGAPYNAELEQEYDAALQLRETMLKARPDKAARAWLTKALQKDEEFTSQIPNAWVSQFTARPAVQFLKGMAEFADVFIPGENVDPEAAENAAPGALRNRFEAGGNANADILSSGVSSIATLLTPGLVGKLASKMAPAAVANAITTSRASASYSTLFAQTMGESWAQAMRTAQDLQSEDPEKAESIRRWALLTSAARGVTALASERIFKEEAMLVGKATAGNRLLNAATAPLKEGVESAAEAAANNLTGLNALQGQRDMDVLQALKEGMIAGVAFSPLAATRTRGEPQRPTEETPPGAAVIPASDEAGGSAPGGSAPPSGPGPGPGPAPAPHGPVPIITVGPREMAPPELVRAAEAEAEARRNGTAPPAPVIPLTPAGTLSETPDTYAEQRRRVLSGARGGMIFPGMNAEAIPPVMRPGPEEPLILTETPAGAVLHAMDISSPEVLAAEENDTLGSLLGYGTEAKPDLTTGEPVAVVRRETADGTEESSVAVNSASIGAVTETMEQTAQPGDVIRTLTPGQALRERMKGWDAVQAERVKQRRAEQARRSAEEFRTKWAGRVPGFAQKETPEEARAPREGPGPVTKRVMREDARQKFQYRTPPGQKQAEAFATAQGKLQEEGKGIHRLEGWELQAGDTLTIGGKPVTVTRISSKGEISLDGGSTYGVQRIGPEDTVYAESYKPLEQEQGEQAVPDFLEESAVRTLPGEIATSPKSAKELSAARRTLTQWADDTIRQAADEGRLFTGIDPVLWSAYTVKGVALIKQGITELAAWSARMVQEFGEAIREHLPKLWSESTGEREARMDYAPPGSRSGQPAPSEDVWGVNRFGERVEADPRLREAWRAQFDPAKYRTFTEEQLAADVKGWIARSGGVEGAAALFLDDQSGLADFERNALGMQLAVALDLRERRLEQQGNAEGLAQAERLKDAVIARLEQHATQAGQSLRAFGMWVRLSPRGVVRQVERQTNDKRSDAVSSETGAAAEDVAAAVNDALSLMPQATQEADEISRLWQLMQEARGTDRGAAIAAALKAFMPDRPRDWQRQVDGLQEQGFARIREGMVTRGGEGLARNFWQMMAGPQAPAGPLAQFDTSTQQLLADVLRRAMLAKGLVAENTPTTPDTIDRLVQNLSNDALRWQKITAADEAVRAEIDALENPEQKAKLRDAWETATQGMSFAIGGPAMLRRALRDAMQGKDKPDWRKMFDTGRPMAEVTRPVRDAAVSAVLDQVRGRMIDPNPHTLTALEHELQQAFDDMARDKYAQWLGQRERIAQAQRVRDLRASFLLALKNRGVAEQELDKLAVLLSDTPTTNPSGAAEIHPVRALIREHAKNPLPDFVARMGELGVTQDVAVPLEAAMAKNRANAEAAAIQKAALLKELRNNGVAEKALDKLATMLSDTPTAKAGRGETNPVQALIMSQAKSPMPDFVERLMALGVSRNVAIPLEKALEKSRANAEIVAREKESLLQEMKNRGVAERALDRLANILSDTPTTGRPSQASPVQELISLHVKDPQPDFVARLMALGVPQKVAIPLEKAMQKSRENAAAVAREKMVDMAVARLKEKAPSPAKVDKDAPPFIRHLLKAHSGGYLSRSEFLEAYASYSGMPRFTPEFRAEITRLAQRVQAAPSGSWLRQKYQTDLLAGLAQWEGLSAAEVATGFWYANILAGLGTQLVNISGNGVHLLGQTMTALAAMHPRHMSAFVQGMVRGAREGIRQGFAAFKDGAPVIKGATEWQQRDILELLHTYTPKTLIGKIGKGLTLNGLGRYVFRALTAMDAIFWNTQKEGRAWLGMSRLLAKEGNLSPQNLITALGLDTATFSQAQDAARIQLAELGEPITPRAIDRRAMEIVEAQRSAEITGDARQQAARTTFMHKPDGALGALEFGLNAIIKRVPPLRAFIPFTRIVAGMGDVAIDWSPWGMVRSVFGARVTTLMAEKMARRVNSDKITAQRFTHQERVEKFMQSALVTLGSAGLYALAKGYRDEDDEDVPFMIYGMGPNDANARSQMPNGWKPFTLKVGGTYVSYAETPLVYVFSALGSALDKERYGNRRGHDDSAFDKAMLLAGGAAKTDRSFIDQTIDNVSVLAGGAAKGFTKTGMLSTIDSLQNYLSGESSSLSGFAGRLASGLIPGQGLLRDIATAMDPVKVDTATFAGAFLQNLPVLRGEVAPQLNVFGEPVRAPGPWIVNRIIAVQNSDPDLRWMVQNKLRVPGIEKNVTPGQWLDDADKARVLRGKSPEERAFTLARFEEDFLSTDERTALIRISGPMIRKAVTDLRTMTERAPRSPAWIKKQFTARVAEARRVAMLEIMHGKPPAKSAPSAIPPRPIPATR